MAFNELHEVVMAKLYESFATDDNFFFEKAKTLADMNVTAEQFGGSENHAIHFSAAVSHTKKNHARKTKPKIKKVVELASLDSHKSPIEKFNCLSTTYDCIFAELKSVLIDVIAKYSENEAEIPIINNSEITPVLMVVLVKSKPMHLASNLFYIEHFLWTNEQAEHIKYILDSFKMAAEALKEVNEKTMRPPSGEVCRSLDLKGVIEITSPQIDCDGGGVAVLREQRDRLGGLIVRATNEANNFI